MKGIHYAAAALVLATISFMIVWLLGMFVVWDFFWPTTQFWRAVFAVALASWGFLGFLVWVKP